MGGLEAVSIVIPVFNEKKTIARIVEKVLSIGPGEIIIVNDGSTDGTDEILEKFANRENSKIKIITSRANRGKGAAIRCAFAEAKCGIVAIQDADLEYDPEEIQTLIMPIVNGTADIVYGSRFLSTPMNNIYLRYKLGNWLLSKLISILFGQTITDAYTCYKIFKREVIQDIELKSDRFEIEAEMTVKILKRGIHIREMPISYNPRRLEEGKKIGWIDAAKGLYTIVRYSF